MGDHAISEVLQYGSLGLLFVVLLGIFGLIKIGMPAMMSLVKEMMLNLRENTAATNAASAAAMANTTALQSLAREVNTSMHQILEKIDHASRLSEERSHRLTMDMVEARAVKG